MICPIFFTARLHEPSAITWTQVQCSENDCAWWDDEKYICSIKVIAKELTNIQIKMPHVGQFVTPP